MKNLTIITLTLISAVFSAQSSKYRSNADYRLVCSEPTKVILTKLQSLTSTFENDFIEFRVYGNDSMQSEKFLQYVKLYDTANEAELLSVIEGSNSLSSAVRGYAYMAYAFRCDKEKRKEDPLTGFTKYFFLHVQNGLNVQRDMKFSDFKSFCRIGNKYCPHIEEELINSDEPGTKKRRKG